MRNAELAMTVAAITYNVLEELRSMNMLLQFSLAFQDPGDAFPSHIA
jgi:hypothetical protein